VAAYRNVVLPAPLVFEDFDSVTEGQVPTGWTLKSYTEVVNPDLDLGNLDSASYANWVVVEASRFTGSFVTYSDPASPPAWGTDYQRVLSVNPLNVLNGAVYRQPLAAGRLLFGNSGYRNGRSQVLYVTTPDYDLTGKTNIHLSFFSAYEQNQDSIGLVEYSVDQGATWLPALYLLDRPDLVYATNGNDVVVDAPATFNAAQADAPLYTDEFMMEQGGTYGAFLGAAITQTLAPFVSARKNDDPVESKRIELLRLAGADGQAKVRVRFGYAGTDSWYFGVDNFGLYSIATTPAAGPQVTAQVSAGSMQLTWTGGTGPFQVQKTASLGSPDWQSVGAPTSERSFSDPVGVGPAFYRVQAQP
jgi:hypothetical protein